MDFTTSMPSDSSVFTACNVSRKSVPNDGRNASSGRNARGDEWGGGMRGYGRKKGPYGPVLHSSDAIYLQATINPDRRDYLFGGQGANGIAKAAG